MTTLDKSDCTPSLIEETPLPSKGSFPPARLSLSVRCALLHPGGGHRHILLSAWFSALMACRRSARVTANLAQRCPVEPVVSEGTGYVRRPCRQRFGHHAGAHSPPRFAWRLYQREIPERRDFAPVISAGDVRELGTRRYTSIVDLNLVLRLSRLKQVVPQRMLVCYARDLRMDDVRSGNAILLGSVDANPWVGLFEQQLNFRFSFDPKSDSAPVILNQHPLAGEQLVYANHHDGSWHSTFGRIAYLIQP